MIGNEILLPGPYWNWQMLAVQMCHGALHVDLTYFRNSDWHLKVMFI